MRRTVLIAIAAALVAGGAWVYAQAEVQVVPLPQANILSGADIGFRVDEMAGGRAIGRLVVRLKDGSWVEAQLGRPGVHPLHGR